MFEETHVNNIGYCLYVYLSVSAAQQRWESVSLLSDTFYVNAKNVCVVITLLVLL